MNSALIFCLTFMDSLFGCLQVFNLVHSKRAAALITSFAISTSKLLALVLVLKSTSAPAVLAYIAGGALGAQCSIHLRNRSRIQGDRG